MNDLQLVVYLSGPIAGCSYNDAVMWRKRFESQLFGIVEVLSPMRGKEALKGTECITNEMLSMKREDGTYLWTPELVLARDKFDIQRSDICVFNFLDTTAVTIGSVMEFGWATAPGKKRIILTLMREENIHRHSFILQQSDYITTEYDRVISIIKQIAGVY